MTRPLPTVKTTATEAYNDRRPGPARDGVASSAEAKAIAAAELRLGRWTERFRQARTLKFDTGLPAAINGLHGLLECQAEAEIEAAAAALHALQLEHRYNVDQPRVPAGTSTGGQWIGNNHRVTGSAAPKPVAKPKLSGTDRQIVRTQQIDDPSGQQSWSARIIGYDAAGNIVGEGVANRDGSTIQATYDPSGNGPFDSQYKITSPDGSAFVFTNSGDLQTVTDASTGQVVSQSLNGPAGVTPLPVDVATSSTGDLSATPVQLAPTVPGPPQLTLSLMAVSAAIVLYQYLSSLWSQPSTGTPAADAADVPPGIADPNAIPVLSVTKTREYDPAAGNSAVNVFVGAQSVAQVRQACQAYDRIQAWTDEAVSALSRADFASPQAYGIAVHSYVEVAVRASGDPALSAEMKLYPGDGLGPSIVIRPDIVENVGNGTLCVYDIKTGAAGLPAGRADQFADRIIEKFGGAASRILVITVRPSR